jgi:hypothetical protein
MLVGFIGGSFRGFSELVNGLESYFLLMFISLIRYDIHEIYVLDQRLGNR